MVTIIWTDQAVEDLAAIGKSIGDTAEPNAKIIVKNLCDRTAILKQYPNAGLIVPEKNEESIRELFQDGYRIFYFIEHPTRVYILGAREIKSN